MSISIEQIKQESDRKEQIKEIVNDLKIGLSSEHEQILDRLVVEMLEFLDGCMNKAKL